MEFNKKALPVEEQIILLKNRGLIINDESFAKDILGNISYYRLRAYFHTFYNSPFGEEHQFIIDTNFNDILNLYVFDRKLRILIFDAIEKIEVSLRTQIIYHFSLSFGNLWFQNKSLFISEDVFRECLKNFDDELKRTKEHFIEHYNKKYGNPKLPPAWMMLEIVSIGTLSKLYRNLKMSPEKKKVANHFYSRHPHNLESWIQSLSFIRNICAHHQRLWNRKITIKPTIPRFFYEDKLLSHDRFNIDKIFSIMCIIIHLLKIISPTDKFKYKFKELLQKYPIARVSNMGFPYDWENFNIWK
jgi:abortive infection bacteriophage resistance protein